MSFCFSTFEIRSQHTQKSVDYNELDRLICEKFDLKYSNEDYGHFPFLEGEMHQESISWAGLIHEIVYWSDIDYGTRTMGMSNIKVLTGSFDNDEFGRYRLAVYKDVSEAIVIHTADEIYVVNVDSSESTIRLFNELSSKV